MGNSSKKAEDFDVVNTYNRQQWINKERRNGFQIWQNTQTKIRADAYPIHKSIKSNDLENYELRRNNSSNIVKVHHVGFEKSQNLCSKSSGAVILTERIPLRLDGTFNLSQYEALCVLRSAYNGFNTLGSFYGPIEPYQDMICFNDQGRPKVWLNSNLSSNEPQEKRQDKNKKDLTQRNQIYVNKILDMVESRTSGYRSPNTIVDKFRQIGPKNYFEAINILQQYAAENRIQIPETIDMLSRVQEKSLKASMFSQFPNISSQTNNHNNLAASRTNFQPLQKIQNFNSRHTINGTLKYDQNIQQIHTQRNLLQTNQNNSFYGNHITRMENANRSPHSQYQPYRQTSFTQYQHPFHNNNHNHNTVSQNQIYPQQVRPNVVFQRSRSGQIKQIQSLDRTPSISFSPRVIPGSSQVHHNASSHFTAGPPLQIISQTAPIIQHNMKFDSPSKVVFNEVVQYNRVLKQQPISPRKLGHVRKENSQQFIEIMQQRVDPELPKNISLIQNQKTHLEEEQEYEEKQLGQQKILQNKFQKNDSNNVDTEEYQRGRQQYNLQQHEQKYVDSLEEEQARQEDEYDQNPDTQYADYIKKQKLRQQEEQQMRKQMQRYQNDHGQSDNQEQENSEQNYYQRQYQQNNLQEHHQNQLYKEEKQNNHFESRNDYLVRKDTDENDEQQYVQRQQTQEWNQRQQEQEYIHQQRNMHLEKEQRNGQIFGQRDYVEYVKQRNQHIKKQTTQSVEGANELQKQFGQKQLQNATSQEYFCDVENSEVQNERIQTNIKKNPNIQRVVSMQKKFTESSLGLSGGIKGDDIEGEYSYEPKRQEPIPVESQYLRGEKGSEINNLEQIPQDAKYQDIQAYIKQKYSSYLRDGSDNAYQSSKPIFNQGKKYSDDEEDYDVRKMAWYVESKYDQMKSSKTAQQIVRRQSFNKKNSIEGRQNQQDERISDMLDVKNMQRSLDKKYSSMKSQPKIEDQKPDENQFDIKKLEQNLIRFEQSRVGGGQVQNSSQVQNFQTSQVQKVGSFEDRVNRRNSSISRQINFKQQNSYTYIVEKDYRKPSSINSGMDKQRDSFTNSYTKTNYNVPSVSKKYSRNSKIQNFLDSIDEKFNKYVNNNSSRNTDRYSALNPTETYPKKSSYEGKKNYESSYRNYQPENENNYISSRLATAKFEYAESEEGKKNVLEPKYNSNKDLTYDQLRKYMWS